MKSVSLFSSLAALFLTSQAFAGDLNIVANTYFKASTKQSADLPANQKCSFSAGAQLEYSSISTEGVHYRVRLNEVPSGCSFKTGYFYIPHVTISGAPTDPVEPPPSRIPFPSPFLGTVVGLHEITTSPNPKDGGYITPTQLGSLIMRVKNSGCRFLSLEEIMRSNDVNGVALTFDDGYKGVYQNAISVLRKHKVPATFFIHPTSIGSSNGAYPKMTWSEVKQLSADPLFTIESHSLKHQDLRKLSSSHLNQDFVSSNTQIKSNTGKTPLFIAYPMGHNNSTIHAVASKFYQFGFSYGTSSFSSKRNRFALPRMAVFQNNVNKVNPCH